MPIHQVAHRYAKSLIDLANEQGKLDEVHEDMQLLRTICKQNRDFVNMLNNPIIVSDKKLRIIKTVFSDKVQKLTSAFFEIITKKHRENILPSIAEAMHIQYNKIMKIQEAKVTTTYALDDQMRAKFKEIVAHFSGRKVALTEEVKEELIGGFILNVGDRQMDASISSQLSRLNYELTKNLYQKKI